MIVINILVVYSSRTGNTLQLAEAILTALPADTDFYPVESAPAPDMYDIILLGFWVNRGHMDMQAQSYMKRLKNKKVALFATLGAFPNSEHAQTSMNHARKLLDPSNELIGEFICQGRMDRKRMEQLVNDDSKHSFFQTPTFQDMLREADKHPDEHDLDQAAQMFRKIIHQVHQP